MFGTMGVTELILILAIVLIVFGAGKLPKIGEGVGKALKGFKKEMREVEPPPQAPEQAHAVDAQVVSGGPQPVPPPQPSGQPTPQTAATASRRATTSSGRNAQPRNTGLDSCGPGAAFRFQSSREQGRRRARHGPAERLEGQATASPPAGGERAHDGSPGVGSGWHAASPGSPCQQGSKPEGPGKAGVRHWRCAAYLPRGRQ